MGNDAGWGILGMVMFGLAAIGLYQCYDWVYPKTQQEMTCVKRYESIEFETENGSMEVKYSKGAKRTIDEYFLHKEAHSGPMDAKEVYSTIRKMDIDKDMHITTDEAHAFTSSYRNYR